MIQISTLDRQKKMEYLDALNDAIYSSVEYVQFNGQQVKFRSMQDMFRIRVLLMDELGLNKMSRERYKGPRRAVVRMGGNV